MTRPIPSALIIAAALIGLALLTIFDFVDEAVLQTAILVVPVATSGFYLRSCRRRSAEA